MCICGFGESKFIDGGRGIRFDVECPLHQCSIDENGTVKGGLEIEDMGFSKDGDQTHAVAMYCPGHTLYQSQERKKIIARR